jgi:hypothetical protein
MSSDIPLPIAMLLAVSLALASCSGAGGADTGRSDGPRPAQAEAVSSFPTDDKGLLAKADEVSARYRVRRGIYVVLVDYTRNLMQDRLYLVNRRTRKVVLRARVSHAWASGVLRPTDFSNVPESRKSSHGAFETMTSYRGAWGYSMRIRGLDRGLNDMAEKRSVVFHSTERMKGPYTWGCFATSGDVNRRLIDSIQGGSLVYVHR